jgi:hypothetical protein
LSFEACLAQDAITEPSGAVDLLHTTAHDQDEGWPPHIIMGIVLAERDPDTPEFVIPAVANGIQELLKRTSVNIQTIGFDDDLWLARMDAVQMGRQFALSFGR